MPPTSLSLPVPSEATTVLIFFTVVLLVLKCRKLYHIVCSLLHKTSFTQCNASEVHPCCYVHWQIGPFIVKQCSSYGCPTSDLCIVLWLNTWVVSAFQLLWTKLVWIFTYTLLCGHIFSFLLGEYLGVGWLAHRINVCLTSYKKLPNSFPQWLHHLAFPLVVYERSNTWYHLSFSF